MKYISPAWTRHADGPLSDATVARNSIVFNAADLAMRGVRETGVCLSLQKEKQCATRSSTATNAQPPLITSCTLYNNIITHGDGSSVCDDWASARATARHFQAPNSSLSRFQ